MQELRNPKLAMQLVQTNPIVNQIQEPVLLDSLLGPGDEGRDDGRVRGGEEGEVDGV